MKKWIILFIITMMQQFVVSAQDLLVTNNGDSINCKITNVRDDYIYFTFLHQNEVRNTLLAREQVKHFQYGFYAVPAVQSYQIAENKPTDFQKGRIAANVGWGHRTAPTAKGLSTAQKDHIKKLKSGLNISFDASYFIAEMYGIGFKYDLFKSSNSTRDYEDDISISFLGPAFAMRYFDKSKTSYLFMNFALGYMGFKDEGKAFGTKGTIKGSTFGAAMDFGYDFALSETWGFGLQLSLLSGTLTNIDVTGNGRTQTVKLDKDEYEGLGRLNLSVGLRCNF